MGFALFYYVCSYARIISSFILLTVWKEEYEYLELFGHRSVKLTIRKECSLHVTSRGIFQVVVIGLNHLCDVFSSLSFPMFISAVGFITTEIGRGILNIKLIVPYLMNFSIICSEKAMAPHSSTLAWKIPWMEEPCRLQSMGSRRVRNDWATSLSLFPFMHWRRKWQPTPVFLPGESQGRGSLVGCLLWGRTESDTTEVT